MKNRSKIAKMNEDCCKDVLNLGRDLMIKKN